MGSTEEEKDLEDIERLLKINEMVYEKTKANQNK